MSLKERASELSKNQRALASMLKLVAIGVVASVVMYADIQFIQVMWKSYPDGIAKIFSLIGAVATGASVLALVGAEAFWFSRGSQMVFGWIFTGVEVAIMACNDILGFELSGAGGLTHLDQFTSAYLWFCPATPVVAAVCWIIIFNLDQDQKARHDAREIEDDLAEAERDHTKAVHRSKMVLKQRYLASTTAYLEQIADDPQIQAGLRAGAYKLASEELRQLTGMHTAAPALPTGPVVDAKPPLPPTPPASSAPIESPEPEPEKKPTWFKNPFVRENETKVPTYVDDLADSVGGASASPLELRASQNGH